MQAVSRTLDMSECNLLWEKKHSGWICPPPNFEMHAFDVISDWQDVKVSFFCTNVALLSAVIVDAMSLVFVNVGSQTSAFVVLQLDGNIPYP